MHVCYRSRSRLLAPVTLNRQASRSIAGHQIDPVRPAAIIPYHLSVYCRQPQAAPSSNTPHDLSIAISLGGS